MNKSRPKACEESLQKFKTTLKLNLLRLDSYYSLQTNSSQTATYISDNDPTLKCLS